MPATDSNRAIEIAAAGAHSVLFIGPPGRHESRLAHRLAELMSTPTRDETRTAITASAQPAPRTIPFARHRGPFPGELSELERPPDGVRELGWIGLVTTPPAPNQSTYPAPFQLLAAINPCPCGYADDGTGRCRCSRHSIRRYRRRLSGPLPDRLDLHVRVRPTDLTTLLDTHHVRNSNEALRLRVTCARARQLERQGALNSALQAPDLERFASPDRETSDLLEFVTRRFDLSGRAYERTLRVARTIADLAGTDAITVHHVSEALIFRHLDTAGPDAHGLDTPGLDTPGLDTPGLDTPGPDTPGPDAHGLVAAGLETAGFDAHGLDTDGLDTDVHTTSSARVQARVRAFLSPPHPR